MTAVREAILNLLKRHPEGLTDNDIAHLYDGPLASASGLRTRRSELVNAGLVVDSDRRDTLASGRKAVVWEVAPRV